jgi:hypothetical protein
MLKNFSAYICAKHPVLYQMKFVTPFAILTASVNSSLSGGGNRAESPGRVVDSVISGKSGSLPLAQARAVFDKVARRRQADPRGEALAEAKILEGDVESVPMPLSWARNVFL